MGHHSGATVTAAKNRVVITGIGMVTPLGNSYGDTMAALERGETPQESRLKIDGSEKSIRLSRIDDFQPRHHFRLPKALKLANRRTELAVAAASMAIEDAGLKDVVLSALRHQVLIGVSSSDLHIEQLGKAIGHDPEKRSATDVPFFSKRLLGGLNPLWLLTHLPNMVSAHVAIQLDATGPNSTLMTAGVAGQQAIGEGFRAIQSGETDLVVAGGADYAHSLFDLACFARDDLFSDQIDKRYIAASEGSAVLILENIHPAEKRNAHVYCEITGFADMGPPSNGVSGASITRSLRRVLDESEWSDQNVNRVARTLTGHKEVDDGVSAAYVDALGPGSAALPAIEFDSRLGHAFAAAGPITCALMADQLTRNGDIERVVSHAMSSSGHSCTIALQRARKEDLSDTDDRLVN